MYKTRGFSLLEIMVVLGIIAILALLAIPSFTANSLKNNREQVQEAYAHLERLKPLVLAYRSLELECPENESEAVDGFGIAAANAYSGHFTARITAAGEADDDGGCTIVARFKSDGVNVKLKGAHMSLRLFGLEAGVPKWACHTDIDSEGYVLVPRVCRFTTSELAEDAQAPEAGTDTDSDSTDD